MIPYSSRTVDLILHPSVELKNIKTRSVIDELRYQCTDFENITEAVVHIAPERFRVTFTTARKMLAFSQTDCHIAGHPVEIRSLSPNTWVNISRLSYGIPDEAISKALEPYGVIKSISQEAYKKIYTGVRNVLMQITANIPGRLRIAGHWCIVRYKGQKPVCFKCHAPGHTMSNCPKRHNAHAQSTQSATTSKRSEKAILNSLPLVSYAAVVSGSSAEDSDGYLSARGDVPSHDSASSEVPEKREDISKTPSSEVPVQKSSATKGPQRSATVAPKATASKAASEATPSASTQPPKPSSSLPVSPRKGKGKRRRSPSPSTEKTSTPSPSPQCEAPAPKRDALEAPTSEEEGNSSDDLSESDTESFATVSEGKTIEELEDMDSALQDLLTENFSETSHSLSDSAAQAALTLFDLAHLPLPEDDEEF